MGESIINGEASGTPEELVSDDVPDLKEVHGTYVLIDDTWRWGIPITKILTGVFEEYDSIEEIHVMHSPTADSPIDNYIYIRIPERSSQEKLDFYPPIGNILFNLIGEGTCRHGNIIVVLDVMNDIEYSEGKLRTTVYRDTSAENGGEPRSLEAGVRILKKKLRMVCPVCGEEYGSTSSHLTPQGECRKTQEVTQMSDVEVGILQAGLEEDVGFCYIFRSWGVPSVAKEGDTVVVDEEETEVVDIGTEDGTVEMVLKNGKTVEWDGSGGPQTEDGECDAMLYVTDKEIPGRMVEELRGDRSAELLNIYTTLEFLIPLAGSPKQEPEIGFVHRLQLVGEETTRDDGRIHIEIYETEGYCFVHHRISYPDLEPKPDVERYKSREPVREFSSLEDALDYVIQKDELRAKKRMLGSITYELNGTISNVIGELEEEQLNSKATRYTGANII